MTRTPIPNSTRVISMGWEAETMEVEFNNRSVYTYHPVPKETFDKLLASPSVGTEINRVVFDKDITCNRIFDGSGTRK